MKLSEIRPIAEKYKALLAPYCKKNKIKIAGSIRREKEECGDIELVLMRDESRLLESKFIEIVDSWERIRGDATGRYAQRILPEGVKLDLFMAQDDNYINILIQRTGNWKFSRWLLGIRAKQQGYMHRNGYLWQGDEKVIVQTEQEFFDLMGVKYLEPKDREWT